MFEDLENSSDEKQNHIQEKENLINPSKKDNIIQEKEIIQKQESIKEDIPIKKKEFSNLKEDYDSKLRNFEKNVDYQKKDKPPLVKDKKIKKKFSLAKIFIITFVVLLLGAGFFFYYVKGEAMLLSNQMKWDWGNQTENYYLENSLSLELRDINLSNNEANSLFPIPERVELISNLYSTIIGNNSDNFFELKLDIGSKVDLNLNLRKVDNNLYFKPKITGLKDVIPFLQLPEIDSKDEWVFLEMDSEELSSMGFMDFMNFESFLSKNNFQDKISKEKIISFLNIIKDGKIFSMKDPHENKELEGANLKKIDYSLERSKVDEFIFLCIDVFSEDENQIQKARDNFTKLKTDKPQEWENVENFISNLKISLWVNTKTKVIRGFDLISKDIFINLDEVSANLNLGLSSIREDIGNESILSPESYISMEEFLQSTEGLMRDPQLPSGNDTQVMKLGGDNDRQVMKLGGNQDSYNNEEDNRKDSDQDGILDYIEKMIGTDLNNPDSDGDGYNDGEEIENGYSPLGEGEIDSDFLKLYNNSNIIYSKHMLCEKTGGTWIIRPVVAEEDCSSIIDNRECTFTKSCVWSGDSDGNQWCEKKSDYCDCPSKGFSSIRGCY